MTPIPVVVVPADRLREPSSRPEQLEDPGFGVVGGEDGGARVLAVDTLHDVDDVRPTRHLAEILVDPTDLVRAAERQQRHR